MGHTEQSNVQPVANRCVQDHSRAVTAATVTSRFEPYRAGMTAQQATLAPGESARPSAPDALPLLSLPRVVGTLQVVLATRRAARNVDHARLYSVTRSL
jgi:hypothetical protein